MNQNYIDTIVLLIALIVSPVLILYAVYLLATDKHGYLLENEGFMTKKRADALRKFMSLPDSEKKKIINNLKSKHTHE